MQQSPDLTLYRLIHRGMRRDTARVVAALGSMGVADERRAVALAHWYQGFLTEFHGHHTVEDTIFFPALGGHVAGFESVIARIDREHAALNDALDSLGQSLDALAARDVQWTHARGDAVACAAEAAQILTAHLDFEDDEILPLFERHMSKEEYALLDDAALKLNSIRTLLFAVPWVVSQTTPQEKTEVLAMAPLPMRLIWRATRRRYERLEVDAFGSTGVNDALAAVTSGRGVA